MTLAQQVYFDVCVLLLGLFFGSFFNVCIWRIPRRKSIVRPPSHCPRCKTPIRFYDNIPVLSWLLLRGKCRACGKPISARYPLVEALTGVLFLLLALRFGVSWQLLRGLVFAGILVIVAFIDLDTQVIPDAISLPGVAVGLLSSLLVRELVPALIGAAAGAALIFLAGWFWKLATRREGMGSGDVVLAAMMGSFLGWRQGLLAIFLGVVMGVIVGGGAALLRRRDLNRPIPFGPYLALGSITALFAGEVIVRWYGGLFR
jgi:leader peptidase (prepilin peptidase)/N-methyltransferase